MEFVMLFIAVLFVGSVAWSSYRVGKEDGWQDGVAWAIRADLTQLRSPEFEAARMRRTEDRPARRSDD